MQYGTRVGEKFPPLRGVRCHGWLHDEGMGRDGWVIHLFDRARWAARPGAGHWWRYLRAYHHAGDGYWLTEITDGGRTLVPVAGPFRRLAEVKQAGLDYLIAAYGLAEEA